MNYPRTASYLLLAGYAICLLQIWLPGYYLTGDGPCHLYNAQILHDLWAGKKTLSLWLKGDGNPGPIRAYLTYSPNYYLEVERKNYTVVDLVPTGSTFALGWNEYSIPLSKVGRLAEISTLFLDSSHRKLQLGPILLKP